MREIVNALLYQSWTGCQWSLLPHDLPLKRKNIENTRAKLKRLVSLGILAETEPGLFAQPRP
ncbi:hypothetical protein ACWDWV_00245 [Streptosporangium sandarakinum]